MLPYSRNPFFLGREEVLVRLRRHLQAGQTMAFPQPQAICGLGGLGKTQGDHLITYWLSRTFDRRRVWWLAIRQDLWVH